MARMVTEAKTEVARTKTVTLTAWEKTSRPTHQEARYESDSLVTETRTRTVFRGLV